MRSNSNIIMATIINTGISLGVFGLLLHIGDRIISVLGGSVLLLPVVLLYMYASYAIYELRLEICLQNVVVLLMLSLNYLNNIDHLYGLAQLKFAYIYSIVHALIVTCYYNIVSRNINIKCVGADEDELLTIKSNVLYVFLTCNIFPFGYIITVAVLLSAFHPHFHRYEYYGLSTISISYIFAILGFSVTLFRISQFGKDELYFAFKNNKEDHIISINSDKLSKIYGGCLIIIFIIGSIFEQWRHQWLLWVETVAAIAFGGILTLMICKYKARKSSARLMTTIDHVSSIDAHLVMILKSVCFHVVGLALVAIGIVALYYHSRIK